MNHPSDTKASDLASMRNPFLLDRISGPDLTVVSLRSSCPWFIRGHLGLFDAQKKTKFFLEREIFPCAKHYAAQIKLCILTKS
ncbi:hypothetical protein A7E75_02195 [Syntrophotalea acetylenica]|uniref:Uncharacterized protein n=1 Tax=Syntrophotalea acetylenica TaxID=29542 RepID=A0A1L3GDD8_SYNAC|nr:hypothetical protein A7E75_02195 [Syntrophotalea acetylenica]APG44546.1 hypothetical protein A6070_10815 [Syntrophotalea acetylenica]